MHNEPEPKPTLAEYIRPLWQRKWLILVAVVASTAAVYGYSASRSAVYTAGTLVFARDPGDPVTGAPAPQSTDRGVQNQAALLYTRRTAEEVRESIGFAGTAQELLSAVTIEARSGEDIVAVTAEAGEPQLAADIANGFAEAFVELSREQQRERVQRALGVARKQLDELPLSPQTRATRAELDEQIRRLELAISVPAVNAQLVDPALPPPSPSSPKPLRNALFAFVISLVLSVGIAYGLERFDRRLRRPEEVEDVYGLPLLAVVPHSSEPTLLVKGVVAMHPAFREAFRTLRTNLDLANVDRPAKTVVVTSAVPSEGKSTVVRNLALAYGETGRRVAVVEADLRRPALARSLGQPEGPGLSDVLTGERSLQEAVVRVPIEVSGLDTLARLGRLNDRPADDRLETSVTLLRSGPAPANPVAVLESERVRQLLDELRAHHDVVIIDSAPFVSVSDTVPLVRYADATVLVTRFGFSTRETARRLLSMLGRVPDARPVGVVGNDLPLLDVTSYGYVDYGDPKPAASTARMTA